MPNPTDFPVSQLQARYAVGRTQVYARLNALKAINPSLAQFQSGGKAWVNEVVLAHLDQMNDLMSSGYGIDDAARAATQNTVTEIVPNTDQTVSVELRPVLSGQNGAIAKIDDVASSSDESVVILQIREQLSNRTFARYELLDMLADKGWFLPSSELAVILGIRKLSGREFERYNYRFTRQGRAGSEFTWKVERLLS